MKSGTHLGSRLGLVVGVLTGLSAGLAGCGQSSGRLDNSFDSSPVVETARTQVGKLRPSVSTESGSAPEVQVTLTVNKQSLLNQEFLYGADLQYSSLYDADMDLYNQSMALGHIPARFRIAGNELQLIADNRRLYPSEVNHPEQLISRFTILEQTETTLTLSGANSGGFLAQIFEGTHNPVSGSSLNPEGRPPRDLWIRSFEFVNEGNYLLQQTSFVTADGSVAEFMESIFPRSTIVPGAQFQKFEMDPNDPIGGKDGAVARFRFIRSEKVFQGEKALSFAQHFDLSPRADGTPGTIDWYVTRNIPDEFLAPVREAVEGWNRYFNHFQGIQREVVSFKGRLPEGVHLGDPRYNVINWDNRLVAGAAYESQASDPSTGKQSHSLIYMPAAWVQIGTDYWKYGVFSDHPDSISTNRPPSTGPRPRLACLRNIRDAAALATSGRLTEDEIQVFGIQLLKQTLFHEVGHALGLDHNFKGSLSFDRQDVHSLFSTSIMDYNDFEAERGAFESPTSAAGPELEYDRQALSALYNQQKDIRSNDPVVSTCNDAEADQEEGGVDPLCIRYDIEKDPTLSVNTALHRIENEEVPMDVSLAQALKNIPRLILTADRIGAVKTEDDLNETADKVAQAIKGAMSFYFVSGKTSLLRAVRNNLRSLLAFEDGVLPNGYVEKEMRDRAFHGVERSLSLMSVPSVVQTALIEAQNQTLRALANTPFLQSLDKKSSKRILTAVSLVLVHKVGAFMEDTQSGLPKLREGILNRLVRPKKVAHFFGRLGRTQVDYEAALTQILSEATLARVTRTLPERIAAATALASYRGRSSLTDRLLERTMQNLKRERDQATDNASREAAIQVLAAALPVN